MMFQLNSQVDVDRRSTSVAVSGCLAGAAVPLRRQLFAIVDVAGPRIELDLGSAEDVDRATLGTLLAVHRQLHMLGGWLRVVVGPAGSGDPELAELGLHPAGSVLRLDGADAASGAVASQR